MIKLRRDLGLLEAFGLSLSVIAPTMAMAFSTTLAVGAAGVFAPLSFVFGAFAMIIVGFCFVAFARRVSNSGSVYAYVGHTFGPRCGFMSGWALLLTYFMLTAGAAAMVGNFVAAFFAEWGIQSPHLWLYISALGMLVCLWLTWNDARIATRVMLGLEMLSVCSILFLAIRILMRVPLSRVPFHPNNFHAWSGIGYGMIFAILSFSGFEGAATLGEETRDPKRVIPLAIIGTLVLSGILYVIVMYAQVVGYGIDHIQTLAQAEAPLSDLSNRFVSRQFAECIDLATATSAFACVIGSLSAAARMLYTLAPAGGVPWLAVLHPKNSTPARALLAVSGSSIAALLLWGIKVGPIVFGGSVVTIGILSLILVYLSMTAAETAEAFRRRHVGWIVLGLAGTILLLWPLYNSLYPVPSRPGNLWPYLVIGWMLLGVLKNVFSKSGLLDPSADVPTA